jgi:hypothetical protein
MKYLMPLAAWLFFISPASSHEMTPAYPRFDQSYVSDLSVTRLMLFNRRQDVNYYEIEVTDKDWNPIPFASQAKLLKVDYLSKKQIEIYVRNRDVNKVVYICTVSKLLKENVSATRISSRICSKIKRD